MAQQVNPALEMLTSHSSVLGLSPGFYTLPILLPANAPGS